MAVNNDGWQFVVELTHLYRDVMLINERATGMSQSRIEILHELYHVDEISQADLVRHLGVEGAVITRIVKQMEAEGLVTRRPDPRDNRYTLVAMTDKVRKMHVAAPAQQFKDAFGDQLMEGIDDEAVAGFMEVMRHIAANARTIRENSQTAKEAKAE